MDLDKIALPEGWKIEEIPTLGFVISRPADIGGGFITIDERQRAFAIGMCPVTLSDRIVPKIYTGRRWQQKLVDDAVQWLDNVMTR